MNLEVMTREEAGRFWPIIKAYSEGKQIEFSDPRDGEWNLIEEPDFTDGVNSYRIKKEPVYRPFEDANECWEEMKEHEPFGWIKNDVGIYSLICGTRKDAILFSLNPIDDLDFRNAFSRYVFADGAPFGIKEEE